MLLKKRYQPPKVPVQQPQPDYEEEAPPLPRKPRAKKSTAATKTNTTSEIADLFTATILADSWDLPTMEVLHKFSVSTKTYNDFTYLIGALFSQFSGASSGSSKWFDLLRSLVLLDHLVRYGVADVAIECRNRLAELEPLKKYQYFDPEEDNQDMGGNVRSTALKIITLVTDEQGLRKERRKCRREIAEMSSASAPTTGEQTNATEEPEIGFSSSNVEFDYTFGDTLAPAQQEPEQELTQEEGASVENTAPEQVCSEVKSPAPPLIDMLTGDPVPQRKANPWDDLLGDLIAPQADYSSVPHKTPDSVSQSNGSQFGFVSPSQWPAVTSPLQSVALTIPPNTPSQPTSSPLHLLSTPAPPTPAPIVDSPLYNIPQQQPVLSIIPDKKEPEPTEAEARLARLVDLGSLSRDSKTQYKPKTPMNVMATKATTGPAVFQSSLNSASQTSTNTPVLSPTPLSTINTQPTSGWVVPHALYGGYQQTTRLSYYPGMPVPPAWNVQPNKRS